MHAVATANEVSSTQQQSADGDRAVRFEVRYEHAVFERDLGRRVRQRLSDEVDRLEHRVSVLESSLAAAGDEIKALQQALSEVHVKANDEIQRRGEELGKALGEVRRLDDELREAHRMAGEEIQRREDLIASLRVDLGAARDQMRRCEDEVRLARSHGEETAGRLQAAVSSLHEDLARAREELGNLRMSRLWRLGIRYWRARDRLTRLVDRRAPGT